MLETSQNTQQHWFKVAPSYCQFEWDISELLSLPEVYPNGKGLTFESPLLGDFDLQFELNFYPDGKVAADTGFIIVTICPTGPMKSTYRILSHILIHLVDCDGTKTLIPTNLIELSLTEENVTSYKISRQKMLCHYIRHTKLHIECRVEYIKNVEPKCASTKTISEQLIDDLASDFAASMRLLFSDASSKDITLEIDGKELLAHKAILAECSPVFKRMLSSHAFKEALSRRIKIEDSSFEAAEKMVEFMYTGHIDSVNYESARELLLLANCYDINNLKEFCEEELKKTIDTDNFVEMVLLADLTQSDLLLDAAHLFFTIHRNDIITSAEWHIFKQQCPELFNDFTKKDERANSSHTTSSFTPEIV